MATKANRNIKVSQATIDKIKKQGMTASLKSASSNNSPEYREALRRMYGDARVAKATASTKPSSSGRYVGSMFVPDKPAKTTSGGGKYVGSMFVPDKAPAKKASTSYSPAPMSAAAKAKATAAGAAKRKTKTKTQEQIKQDNYKYQAGQTKTNGSERLAQPLYDALARAYAKTPKAQRDARNKAKALAAAAKKNK